MEYVNIKHDFNPIYDEKSKILILGTFPSVKSRANNFYYGHPQNRFWKVLASLTNEDVPQSIDQKKQLLHKHHIAIWDVIQSCDIVGSSDSSIKNVVPSDLSCILSKTNIQKIYANGKKAKELYDKYTKAKINKDIILLPSTSPANAMYSLQKLIDYWKIIL